MDDGGECHVLKYVYRKRRAGQSGQDSKIDFGLAGWGIRARCFKTRPYGYGNHSLKFMIVLLGGIPKLMRRLVKEI
jgi:hypothetical protein